MKTTLSLSNRERFCKLFDFETVDRPPRWEAIEFWDQTLDEWRALGGVPAHVDALEAMKYYEFDPCPPISAGLGFTQMSLSGPPVKSRVITDDGHTRLMEDDLGTQWRERADGESMPQWLRYSVESPEDWINKIKPRLKPEDHNYGDLEQKSPELEHTQDPVGLWIVGLYAFWRNYWGPENLAYALYDSPETLHDMARTWLRMHCECTSRVFDLVDIDFTFFHEDMAFKNGPLIGPDHFDEFMAPYYKELFSHLKSRGQRRFLLDSDGDNGAVLDRFLEMGLNGFFPLEVAAAGSVKQFREEHPGIFVWGGVDKRVLLKTKDDIKREIMENVPAVWQSGGYIPALDHSVPPCPQENFEYYLELTRSLFPDIT